ncbi:MAG: DinB family protein [Mucilaginibacter polytrichastri]|nr:DinB family protein [Mucilaginibacter polytrichastri]
MNRPQPEEYAAYQKAYIDCVPDDNILDILNRQSDEFARFFAAIPPEKQDFAYAAGKWTVKEVLGHISDTERVFAYRALRIGRGDQTPLPGFEQDPYVEQAGFSGRSMDELIAEFRAVRAASLFLFENFREAQWQNMGTASDRPVSVRTCAYVIAGHPLHHIHLLNERYL